MADDSVSHASIIRKQTLQGRVGHLTQEQIDVLNKLKEKLTPENYSDDHMLLRFLRARKFDLNLTLEMYLNHMNWRRKTKIDQILLTMPPKMNILNLAIPSKFHGFDKDKRPVYYERTGKIDPNLFNYFTDEELLHAHLWSMEVSVYRCYETSTPDNHVETFTTIMDLEGLSLSHFNSAGVIKLFSDCDKLNYPERMGCLCVINAPSVFPMIWKVVKGWLDPVTANKIYILGDDYKETLLSIIDAEHLPQEYGGTCKCPGGCCSIASTEALEKELNKNLTVPHEGFKVKAGLVHTQKEPVKENTFYTYHFHCDNSIDFSVLFHPEDGSPAEIITKPKKVEFSARGFFGEFKAPKNGALEFIFDNKSSWMTSKHLKFGIEVAKEPTRESVKELYFIIYNLIFLII